LQLTDPAGPLPTESRALIHAVAKLHYESDLSQVKIARQLGLSTATISRLLQRARDEGIVRIEVRDLVSPDVLGDQVRARLGLRAVSVIDAPSATLPAALAGPLGAMLLAAAPVPGAVLAVGWGRAIRAVIGAGLPALPGVLVVPATGGLQQHEPHFQINEFVRHAGEQTGGVPHFLHAPYLPADGMRDLFLSDPVIASAVALWDRIDIAVVGIGLPHALNAPEASVATPAEQRLTGAAGDVIRHYFDTSGRIIDWEGEGRMIAVSAAQLARARLSIGVVSGAAKAGPVVGAARAGLITALVADTVAAQAILEQS
jgi:DNA-binding transcriptional regulator LsrR (DeoR family)